MNTFFRHYKLFSVVTFLVYSSFATSASRVKTCSLMAKFAAIALDKQAISNMQGCYEVSYQFEESRSLQPGYELKDDYRVHSLELIDFQTLSERHFRLQHILSAGGHMIHHWSQDWIACPDKKITYVGEKEGRQRWEIEKEAPSNIWMQYVRGVSSEPRYSGVGTWQHGELGHGEESVRHSMWSGLAMAPLPRRDYSVRSDYQLLERFNIHEVLPQGWMHEQLNKKIVQQDIEEGKPSYPLVIEQGKNIYRKVDDSHCADASMWWKEEKPYWEEIEKIWDDILENSDAIEIEKKEDSTLFLDLTLLIHEYKENSGLKDDETKTLFRDRVKKDVFQKWIRTEKK